MATTFDLSGKSILITGAGRGLGRALAIGAHHAGASVTAFDRDTAALAELHRAQSSIATQVVDVVDRVAFAAAARQIGRIDGVVNNAMLIRYDPIRIGRQAIVDQMLAIGIKGGHLECRRCCGTHGPGGERGDTNLASPTAERGLIRPSTAWSRRAGHFGVNAGGPRRVRVNALAPGSSPPGAVAITPPRRNTSGARRAFAAAPGARKVDATAHHCTC